MDVIIASNNKHKIIEIKQILGNCFDCIYSLAERGIEIDVEETGLTFRDNAYLKAEAVCKISGLPALADDSGLSVDSLDGAPGVFSARYSGLHATDEENNKLLLKRLEGVAERTAKFVSVVALVFPNGRKIDAEGETTGKILTVPDGEGGFGYDPLFFSDELSKSFGRASSEEKNAVSHRSKALKNLVKKLSEKS